MSTGREKKTLALFAAIMLFGFSCICAYVFFGHNWNFAVSRFDDTFGDMESYTVILYEGTIVTPEGEPAGFELTLEGSAIPSSSRDSSKDKPAEETAEIAAAGETIKDDVSQTPAEKTLEEVNADAVATDQAPSLGYRIVRKLSSIFNLNTETPASEEESAEVIEDPIVIEEIDVSSIQRAAESYGQKNAVAFVLDSHNLERYRDGMVMDAGGKRVAVFSVTSIQSLLSLQEKVDYLKSMGVDMTIAMVDDVSRIAGVEGLDMVIRCNQAEPLDWNAGSRGYYQALAPAEGSVAATIVSPSNIVLTRVF